MRLSQRKSNGVWYVRFEDKSGKTRRLSCETTAYAEAKKRAPKIVAEALDERVEPVANFYSVDNALNDAWKERWADSKSANAKWYDVETVRRYWQDTPVDAVTTRAVKDWIAKMKQAGLQPSTINNRISSLSTALKVAVENGKLDNVPHFPRAKMKSFEPRSVTPEEEEALKREALALNSQFNRPQGGGPPRLAGTGDVMVNLIEALIQTGMRLSELIRSRPEDRRGNVLRLADQKNGKVGVVALTPDAVDALEFLWNHPTWQQVTDGVLNADGKVNQTRMASARDWCIKRFTVIRNRAKLHDVTIHKLRHTTASRLVQADVSLYKVQKVLRHSSPVVTQRYAALTTDDLQDAVSILSRRKSSHQRDDDNVVQLRSWK